MVAEMGMGHWCGNLFYSSWLWWHKCTNMPEANDEKSRSLQQEVYEELITPIKQVVHRTVEKVHSYDKFQDVYPFSKPGSRSTYLFARSVPLLHSIPQLLCHDPFVDPIGLKKANYCCFGSVKGHDVLEQDPEHQQVNRSAINSITLFQISTNSNFNM